MGCGASSMRGCGASAVRASVILLHSLEHDGSLHDGERLQRMKKAVQKIAIFAKQEPRSHAVIAEERGVEALVVLLKRAHKNLRPGFSDRASLELLVTVSDTLGLLMSSSHKVAEERKSEIAESGGIQSMCGLLRVRAAMSMGAEDYELCGNLIFVLAKLCDGEGDPNSATDLRIYNALVQEGITQILEGIFDRAATSEEGENQNHSGHVGTCVCYGQKLLSHLIATATSLHGPQANEQTQPLVQHMSSLVVFNLHLLSLSPGPRGWMHTLSSLLTLAHSPYAEAALAAFIQNNGVLKLVEYLHRLIPELAESPSTPNVIGTSHIPVVGPARDKSDVAVLVVKRACELLRMICCERDDAVISFAEAGGVAVFSSLFGSFSLNEEDWLLVSRDVLSVFVTLSRTPALCRWMVGARVVEVVLSIMADRREGVGNPNPDQTSVQELTALVLSNLCSHGEEYRSELIRHGAVSSLHQLLMEATEGEAVVAATTAWASPRRHSSLVYSGHVVDSLVMLTGGQEVFDVIDENYIALQVATLCALSHINYPERTRNDYFISDWGRKSGTKRALILHNLLSEDRFRLTIMARHTSTLVPSLLRILSKPLEHIANDVDAQTLSVGCIQNMTYIMDQTMSAYSAMAHSRDDSNAPPNSQLNSQQSKLAEFESMLRTCFEFSKIVSDCKIIESLRRFSQRQAIVSGSQSQQSELRLSVEQVYHLLSHWDAEKQRHGWGNESAAEALQLVGPQNESPQELTRTDLHLHSSKVTSYAVKGTARRSKHRSGDNKSPKDEAKSTLADGNDSGDDFDEEEAPEHVMVSYNHGVKKQVTMIVDALKKEGLKVWVDYQNMEEEARLGGVYEAMGRAVQGSVAVLVCTSSGYQQSANCKLECEYAKEVGKKIFWLTMEPLKEFKVSGWLGLLRGSAFWYDMTPDSIERTMPELMSQLSAYVSGKGGGPKGGGGGGPSGNTAGFRASGGSEDAWDSQPKSEELIKLRMELETKRVDLERRQQEIEHTLKSSEAEVRLAEAKAKEAEMEAKKAEMEANKAVAEARLKESELRWAEVWAQAKKAEAALHIPFPESLKSRDMNDDNKNAGPSGEEVAVGTGPQWIAAHNRRPEVKSIVTELLASGCNPHELFEAMSSYLEDGTDVGKSGEVKHVGNILKRVSSMSGGKIRPAAIVTRTMNRDREGVVML